MYSVYKHTCPNGKVYIGITGDSPQNRWGNGAKYAHNKHFTSAIKQYGWDNIKHEILFDNLTREEACQKEVDLISLYNSNNREFGYNKSVGGEKSSIGCRRTDEEKKIISDKMKGKSNFLGHKHSEITKKKIGDANAKMVCQISSNGEIMNVFRSAAEAAKHMGVTRWAIGRCCNNQEYKCCGFNWAYKEC